MSRPGPRPAPRDLVAALREHRIEPSAAAPASVTWNSTGAPRARYHASAPLQLLAGRKRAFAVRPHRVGAPGYAVREPQPPAVQLLDLRREPELVPDRLELVSPRSRRVHGGTARASLARRPRPPRALARRSARSRASSRRARSPCAVASRSASTSPFASDRSGLTTASKMRFSSPFELRHTPLRRNITAASCTSSSAPASLSSPASGHGATISRVSRAGSCDQISSVTCGITGCSSLSRRSSAASAVARASASPAYRRGLIASAYQSQKSSNVRR